MVQKNGAKGDKDKHGFSKAESENREKQLENKQDMVVDDIPVDEVERDLQDDRHKHRTKQASTNSDPEE